jgi:hypothetical protein
MANHQFHVVYDKLTEGFGLAPFLLLAAAAGGVGLGLVVVFYARRRPGCHLTVFWLVWLIPWVVALTLGVPSVFREHWRCLKWASSGDFRVVEGEVADFKPMPSNGHGWESFVVDGTTFRYSDHGMFINGGFCTTASNGGPMREGLYVRISYHGDRILKIEVVDR